MWCYPTTPSDRRQLKPLRCLICNRHISKVVAVLPVHPFRSKTIIYTIEMHHLQSSYLKGHRGAVNRHGKARLRRFTTTTVRDSQGHPAATLRPRRIISSKPKTPDKLFEKALMHPSALVHYTYMYNEHSFCSREDRTCHTTLAPPKKPSRDCHEAGHLSEAIRR